MLQALGMIECGSMARGAVVTDALLKTSHVHLLLSQPVPPGKLVTAIDGGVADVEAAISVGRGLAGEYLIDSLYIPRIHPGVADGMTRRVERSHVEAVGAVETKTVSAAVRAADQSLKAAAVEMVSIRMGMGIAGRAIYLVSGSVADVNAAVEAGCAGVGDASLLIHSEVIAQPHPDFAQYLGSGPGTVPPLAGMQPPAGD